MMDKQMLDALNVQFNKELASALIYAAMAADFAVKNFNGFARWMTLQAQEETSHAMKIYEFILDRGGRPVYEAMEKPQQSWDSPQKAFEAALAHEQFITQSIDELAGLARKLDDKPAEVFLHWFISEQVEEESTVETILGKFDLIGSNANGLYMLDKELGSRE